MNYFKGTLKSKKCIAPTTLINSVTVVGGKAYKPTKAICGYYVTYNWTGTNGEVIFAIDSN